MKTSDLLSSAGIQTAARAKVIAQVGLGSATPSRLDLGQDRAPRAGLRRYALSGPAPAEVQHHRPITGRQRRAYAQFLVRYEREVREKLATEKVPDDQIEVAVARAMLAAPPLQREPSYATPIRATRLVDLSRR